MTANERAELAECARDASKEADGWAEEDPPYAELMACYAEMAELLDSDIDDSDLKSTLRFLWRRRDAMNQRCEESFSERWAVWCAHNMTSDGGDSEQ